MAQPGSQALSDQALTPLYFPWYRQSFPVRLELDGILLVFPPASCKIEEQTLSILIQVGSRTRAFRAETRTLPKPWKPFRPAGMQPGRAPWEECVPQGADRPHFIQLAQDMENYQVPAEDPDHSLQCCSGPAHLLTSSGGFSVGKMFQSQLSSLTLKIFGFFHFKRL